MKYVALTVNSELSNATLSNGKSSNKVDRLQLAPIARGKTKSAEVFSVTLA
jgi:hypothetical protein